MSDYKQKWLCTHIYGSLLTTISTDPSAALNVNDQQLRRLRDDVGEQSNESNEMSRQVHDLRSQTSINIRQLGQQRQLLNDKANQLIEVMQQRSQTLAERYITIISITSFTFIHSFIHSSMPSTP
jgi:Mg2+ and Co2+ transporter CorA